MYAAVAWTLKSEDAPPGRPGRVRGSEGGVTEGRGVNDVGRDMHGVMDACGASSRALSHMVIWGEQ